MSRLNVLDLNVCCWLTEAVSAHFIYIDCTIMQGRSGEELQWKSPHGTATQMEETFFKKHLLMYIFTIFVDRVFSIELSQLYALSVVQLYGKILFSPLCSQDAAIDVGCRSSLVQIPFLPTKDTLGIATIRLNENKAQHIESLKSKEKKYTSPKL